MEGMRTMLMLVLVSFFAAGCASEPVRKPSKYDNATTANDLFPVEQGMPMREVKPNQEFFFKKCELVNSRAFFTKTEYECTEAQ
jgi:hypothetical protein